MGKNKGLAGGLITPLKEALFGGNTDEEDANAEEAAQAALAEWGNVNLPDLRPVNLQNYEWQGDYAAPSSVTAPVVNAGENVQYNDIDARLADTSLMGNSAFDDVAVDPRLKDSQMGSLAALDEIVQGGGMSARERAQLGHVQSDVAAADRGRRDAILQNMQARGMGGSGMELLAQLQSNQAATDRAAQQGLDIEAQAQDRALQALMSQGQLAGNIRGQDHGEQAQAAAARDAISQFNTAALNSGSQFNANTANSMAQVNAGNQLNTAMYNKDNQLGTAKFNAGNALDVSKTNAGYANDAAKSNWTGKQSMANANTDVANTQKVQNAQLPQQQFQNQVAIAGGKSGAHQASQAYWTGKGDREAAEADQMFGAAMQLGAAGIAKSDERSKTDKHDMSDDDIGAFLNSIQPKRFRYKNPSSPGAADGERVGVMAQDLEKTPLGDKLVTETSDGMKGIDRDNLLGVIVASLGHLAKKGK